MSASWGKALTASLPTPLINKMQLVPFGAREQRIVLKRKLTPVPSRDPLHPHRLKYHKTDNVQPQQVEYIEYDSNETFEEADNSEDLDYRDINPNCHGASLCFQSPPRSEHVG